jgi:tRNA A-37 threonylcarbamoyl transferase component Bud32
MGASDLPQALQASHVLRRRGSVSLLLRRGWEQALPVDALLGGAPLPAWGASVPHALTGRGPIHVLQTPRGQLVVKELRRGGLLGGLARRTFLDPRRGWREAEAAEALAARGIATPEVVAVRSVRLAPGLFRLEIATARVAARGDLLELARAPGTDLRALARAAGATLRRAHDAGLRHRDLNAKNLLVPAEGAREELVVLDLDRCSVGAPLTRAERVAALARLARSLVKRGVLREHAALAACRDFARAYGALPGASPARLLAETAAELHRTLARHALGWSAAGD